MKTILVAFMATVLLTNAGKAQTLTREQTQILNAQMLSAVNVFKTKFAAEKTFETWAKNNDINYQTDNQMLLFKQIYTYLSKGTLAVDILNGDPSSILKVAQDAMKSGVTLNLSQNARLPWWKIIINFIVIVGEQLFCTSQNITNCPLGPVFIEPAP